MVPMERMGLHTKTSKDDDQTKELYSKIRITSKEQKYIFFFFLKCSGFFYFRTNDININLIIKTISVISKKIMRNAKFVNPML